MLRRGWSTKLAGPGPQPCLCKVGDSLGPSGLQAQAMSEHTGIRGKQGLFQDVFLDPVWILLGSHQGPKGGPVWGS